CSSPQPVGRVLARLLFGFRRHEDQELSRRDGASHLSLLVQRNLAQRKHTPPARPVLRTRFAEPAGFSERASCPRGKRRTSLCGALRVLSAGSAATEGPRRSRSRSRSAARATATAPIVAPAVERRKPRALCIREGTSQNPKAETAPARRPATAGLG